VSHKEEPNLALFIDFENLAIGIQNSHYKKFDLQLLLKRLLEKGRIIFKRAYADWSRYSEYKREFHEYAVELFDIPQRAMTGKNYADIKMVVDALDLCYSRLQLIDLFVIASGDSDFSPLVAKLRENGKEVIGVGVKDSSSPLLIENCDEFIFYEDLVRGIHTHKLLENLPKKKKEAFELLIDAILALQRESKEVLWGSMVKQTMQRMKPTFNEEYYGYRTFSNLLEEAADLRIIEIQRDHRSGSYVITGLLLGSD
jgi:uncharacterized protein (TIGR00288 family)